MQWYDPEKVQSDQNMTANAKKNRVEYGVDRPALITTEITRMTEADRIKNELKNVLQLSLTDEQAEQLDTFYKMICEKRELRTLKMLSKSILQTACHWFVLRSFRATFIPFSIWAAEQDFRECLSRLYGQILM